MISQNNLPAAIRKTAIFFASVCCMAAAVGVATPHLAASATPYLPAEHVAAPTALLPAPVPAVPSTRTATVVTAPKPVLDPVAQAKADAHAIFGKRTLKPGQFVWSEKAHQATGASRVIVSIADQRAYVYRGETLVALTTASTGKPGHRTPTGTFKVTEKRKVHFSSKYNNAPMPYMQRLTDYGIALHAGVIPGHPASHGCVRLPHKFAADLFKVTSVGTTVVITA
jgi:lipoprotein-anchoring transpeptidase ErfK/SrfK